MRNAFSPVAITGMHRSGTSMITRGLHQSGLHLVGGDADALLEAADDNPEGFWENKAIVACNDDLLEAAGGAWDNPPTLLPIAVDDPRFAEIVEPATAALAGLAENERWGFKDPRLCLTARFWMDLQPDLRFVICVRNPLEVALSLKRRNQNSYSLGLSLWERYYASVLEIVPPERRIVTHYDAYFLDPAGELARVCDFVGLEPASLEVRSDLRHHDVGVSLDEAGTSPGLRELYAELCEEAGVAAPRPVAADEGRVRRLVLDGTVAARHAEQRQSAIERLEERLAEANAEMTALRNELTEVRRESENRRRELVDRTRDVGKRDQEIRLLREELGHLRSSVANRLETLVTGQHDLADQARRTHDLTDSVADLAQQTATVVDRTAGIVRGLDERQKTVKDRVAHIDDILGAVHVKLRSVEDEVRRQRPLTLRLRGLLGRGARPGRRLAAKSMRRGAPAAKRAARATAKRLPAPVKHNVKRVQRAVADGQAGNRLRERGDRVVAKLPTPARRVVRKGVAVADRVGLGPKTKRVAKGVARRMPARARRAIGEVVAPDSAPRRPPRRAAKAAKATPTPRTRTADAGRAPSVPKGPAAFKWQKGYERLVRECVPAETVFAVATPGCKATVSSVVGRSGRPFPGGADAPPADAQALIAIVEALRADGVAHLVIPEGARGWIDSHPELRDHLAAETTVVEDRVGAGVVHDLTRAPADTPRGLLAEVNRLAAGLDARPAVLDWTAAGVGDELPGYTTFSPPDPARLPYADRSVDIVVGSNGRDLADAERVAAVGVVVTDDDNTVVEVRRLDEGSPDSGTVVVVDPSGRPVNATRAADAGARCVSGVTEIGDAPVVVLVDPGVVVLPGSIEAVAGSVNAEPGHAATAKLLGPDGRLLAAGGTVFADGSRAGIAAGSLDVRGPWHEFVRPVCWGAGMVALRAEHLDADAWTASGSIADFCATLWAAGIPVDYQPDAVVVAVDPVDVDGEAAGYWRERLADRPVRPATLSDGAWRYLVANERLTSGDAAGSER